ncbi:uncharacterized protein TRIADDRAFT_57431 [Trichoplax adhaerens]|uniref:F-box domain-containing protein n=1 Tax=Trichoplax adhaerens TaxID=10228 RepID=B3RZF1_TRIAD|nr:hypothetical protein TRIADDRAFT_57431 [Trichoplax adhaerens]EDV24190.1 hypothetical protein TRIADDRAFT_57431 [Trichoplax adhaerens]|eukprot:XP_002113716.1 hypothetical protein TRIADDRAFT_57431 [Trichoplax adhaerens]
MATASTSIEHLPTELILHIFQFIPIKDYLAVSLVCRNFYHATQSDWIWQQHCKNQYNIREIESWQDIHTFKEFYQKILYRYGPLLGLWYRVVDPYGGLVCIKIDNGAIICNEYVLRRNERLLENSGEFNILHRCLFKIIPCYDDNRISTKILSFSFLGHECMGNIIISKRDEEQLVLEFQLKCLDRDDVALSIIAINSFSNSDTYKQWFLEENPYYDDEDIVTRTLLEKKLYANLFTWQLTSYKRLVSLSQRSISENFPLRCGIYSGSYGAHGVETLHVYIDKNELIGQKLSGDPNVPAGKVSIKAFLDKPVTSESMDRPYVLKDGGKIFPFSLPEDYTHRSHGIPSHYYGEFEGEGQIAYHGYKDAKFIPGRLVVFDKDTFGFLWMERLKSFILFRALSDQDLFLGQAGISWKN